MAIIFLALGLYAQMNKIEFVEYNLDNGLHVILHQDRSTPIVAVTVMYHVGSKNERPKRSGFAHFFEHLLFEGSENIARGEYMKYVTSAGGILNANTFYDRTFYYEVLPSNQLELGLWLESERILHAKVDQKGIETQREVVKEERRLSVDNRPYGSLLEESLSRAYTTHPYKTSVIGSMEDLNAAEESDYKEFYREFYTPNNAILSIAGDLDIEETKALIDKYFSTIPVTNENIFQPNIVEPEMTAQVRDTVYDNIQLPALIMTYRIPAQGTKDFYAVSMLSTLMASGESSRLRKALVDEQQKALQVGSIPLELEDPGVLIAYGIANMGTDLQDLESAFDVEMSEIQTELISDRELQKLKNQVETNFVNANSTVAGIAENLANYSMYYGDASLINADIDRYMAVTKEDIRNAANRYFHKDNRVVLHYLAKSTNP